MQQLMYCAVPASAVNICDNKKFLQCWSLRSDCSESIEFEPRWTKNALDCGYSSKSRKKLKQKRAIENSIELDQLEPTKWSAPTCDGIKRRIAFTGVIFETRPRIKLMHRILAKHNYAEMKHPHWL